MHQQIKIGIFQQFYNWMLAKANTPAAVKWLGGISFAESSFFPLPPDILLVPMILANRAKAWWYATLCSVSSITGGILGYAIGYYLFDTVGEWIINTYGLHGAFNNFQVAFLQYGFWLILLKGLTPIPYKLVTIASGATGLPLLEFVLASMISRSARFFLLSGITWQFGKQAKKVMDENFKIVSVTILSTLILGFFIVKVLTRWISV